MSLNIFLPHLKAPETSAEPSRPSRARRLLGALGPTWLASPARRGVQSASLVLFLVLFFYVAWPYGSPDYDATRRSKELIEAEAFLALDPLVSLSTALAARAWVWSLAWAGAILAVCIVFPRAFCGYVCPLGTLIDLFDWAIGKRVARRRRARRGWWVHLKYDVLLGTLVAAACGVLVTGFLAALPVVTRALFFLLAPVQMGVLKGWYLIPPMNAGHYVSVALFAVVLGLGFLRPRFWCRHVCPSGAIFAVANALRLHERKVGSACIRCNKCLDACPFDAIEPNYATRAADCTFCQTCGGVCPAHAITFAARWYRENLPSSPETANGSPGKIAALEPALSRRGFLAGAAGGLLAVGGVQHLFGARTGKPGTVWPVRPPGSVPEPLFLQLCIRCGECFQACPNSVLQPLGFDQGLDGLWTPQVVAGWSGCEPKCNNCGQVCPTGAIRALPMDEKRAARIGLAVVNEQTCLPYARREACQMCVDECRAAGYDAIEFIRVGAEADTDGKPIEDTGFLAPVVLADKCVGCGLCETRCHKINVRLKRLLSETAVRVAAGPGNEDRLTSGSYVALREKERLEKKTKPVETQKPDGASDGYLPDFLK